MGRAPYEAARREASRLGTTVAGELLAAGLVSPRELRDAMAVELDVEALPRVEPERLILRPRDGLAVLGQGAHAGAHYRQPGGPNLYLVCVETLDPAALEEMLGRRPDLASRLRLVTARDLRAAVSAELRPHLEQSARDRLFLARPGFSARYVANAWQGAAFGALLIGLPIWVVVAPGTAIISIHAMFSVFFMSCVSLRLLALREAAPLRLPPLPRYTARDMPVYTVLVALYREAPVVPQLLDALGQLNWPRSRLEVKLVCEADDAGTLAAIRALDPPPHFEIIEVPPGQPRTKPKALSYALPFCSGSLIALYDAEDRPHRDQLLEAWVRFRDDSTGRLACLQAPLVITNDRAGAIARLFAFEYAAIFRGLLPFLARRNLLLPLGGTSNHFRRDLLERVDGWDPYNVTEDADLGARLARNGFTTGTITRPTFEDGPASLAVWLPQRTRWFKGWMQSWLVHMRNPVAFAREVGFGSFLIAQILFLGMVMSALAHPFLLASLVWVLGSLAVKGTLDTYHGALMGIDGLNIIGGYVAFLLLGWRTLSLREHLGFPRVILFTPVYWVLLSVAAWRAAWQLYRRPHHWEKTPHLPAAGLPRRNAPRTRIPSG